MPLKPLTLLFCLLVPACGSLFHHNNLHSVSLEAVADLNQSMPVAVDIVFLYDEALAVTVAHLSAPEWFERKSHLLLGFPEQIDIVSHELVPTTAPFVPSLPPRHRAARRVLVFANYLAPAGQQPLDISRQRDVVLRLEADHAAVVSADKVGAN